MNTNSDLSSSWTRRDVVASLAVASTLTSATAIAAIPATQKQYRIVGSGSSLKLTQGDAAVRQPGNNEVLIRVKATSLNRRDIMVLRGQYGGGTRDGLVPLSDGAGEVVAIGSKVTRVRIGDRVAGTFFQNWFSGRPPADYGNFALGGSLDGMLSQYVTLSEEGVVALPAHLSFEEAATLPCAAVTAWNGLFTRGHLQRDDNALLLGTGGVSIFGLQLAKAAGARVIITSSSDAKLERAKALGASGLINYRKVADWEKSVRELTNGVGAHHVLEVGGKDSLPHTLASLAVGGHIAIIGGLSGFGGEIPSMALLGNNITASGIYVGSREHFEALNAFVSKHQIKPVVDKVFAFEDAAAAYEHMDADSFIGKVVIRI